MGKFESLPNPTKETSVCTKTISYSIAFLKFKVYLSALTPPDSNEGELNESMGPMGSKNPVGDFQGESKFLLLEVLPTKLSMVVL